MLEIADGKRQATVKEIKPMPGNSFDSEPQSPLVFKKSVKIQIKQEQQQHPYKYCQKKFWNK
jgi:hypothetical protein